MPRLNTARFRLHSDKLFRGMTRRVFATLSREKEEPYLRAPEWLILCVNNVCNLHCRMCDVGLGESGSMFWANLIGDNPHDMTEDLFECILDQADAFFPRPRISLTYTEPLIHPKVLSFVDEIVDRGLYSAITTNGLFLPRLADELVKRGVQEVTVSVDGPSAVHDRIRGRRHSFARLYEGIERLSAARSRRRRRTPKIQLSFTISDLNANHIVDFLDAVKTLDVDAIYISHLNFISDRMARVHNRFHHGDLRVSPSNVHKIDPGSFHPERLYEELRRVDAWIARKKPSFEVRITPRLTSPTEITRYYQEPLSFIGGRRCTSPWEMMMIRTDGSVIPAQGRCFDYALGTVTETPLREIWHGPVFNHFRRILREGGGTLPACSRCCGIVGKPSESVE